VSSFFLHFVSIFVYFCFLFLSLLLRYLCILLFSIFISLLLRNLCIYHLLCYSLLSLYLASSLNLSFCVMYVRWVVPAICIQRERISSSRNFFSSSLANKQFKQKLLNDIIADFVPHGRVARFFLLQNTKTEKIPNNQKMTIKYTKWL
jgi:hypothetical protein